MTYNILQNLHRKTYRHETIVIEQKNSFYTTQKSFARQIEIYYLGKAKEEYRFQVLVVDFDFSDDEDAMGKFLKKISYLFDEIECKVDEDGNITAIDNLLFLRLRWVKIQDELVKTHQGEAVESYFSHISSLLEDEAKLIDFLGGYNMFGLLFNGLLQSFETKRKRETTEGFTEIMTPVKVGDKMILKISAQNLEETDIDHFTGLFVCKGDLYEEGFIEIKKTEFSFKTFIIMDRIKDGGVGEAPEVQNQAPAQDNDQQKAENKQKMDDQRAENEAKDKKDEGLLLAIDGARIKFNAHLGTFKVLSNVPTTQDKLTATVVEKQIPNFIFDDGFQMISMADWQDFGTVKVQDNYVLLKKSTLPGTGKMPGSIPPETGKIEFVTSGQVHAPESIDAKGAPVPEQEKKKSSCSDDFTLLQIKKVWPNASNTSWLQGIVDELNKSYIVKGESKKLYEVFELNTCLNRAHFFAQAFVESSDDLSGAFNGESLNYSVEALRSGYPFSVFKNNKKYYDYADEIGRKSEVDPKTKKKKIVHAADQEKIANIAYDDANRGKDYKLGNVKEGDGWKFRGRGLMQITGRSNYKSIQEIIDSRLPDSGIDLSLGKSMFTAKEAVFAGLGDWILKKANTLSKNGATHEVVNSITAKVNYATKSYSNRRDAFDRTVKIFKDEQ